MVSNSAYGRSFYDDQASISQRSAAAVMPLLLDAVRPRSIVDVGCGAGTWLAVAADLGVDDLLGIDFGGGTPEQRRIRADQFLEHDLTEPIDLGRTFDLAMSLEVAEHLPALHAARFVATLVSLAPVVAFSAAIPGQGGTGHVNEQWQSYWVRHFATHSYRPHSLVRTGVWDDPDVAAYYAQNTIVFADPAWLAERGVDWRELDDPVDVVHPRLYTRQTAHPILFGVSKMLPSGVKNSITSRLRRTRFFDRV